MKIILIFLCTFYINYSLKLNEEKSQKYEQTIIKSVKKPIQYFKGLFGQRGLADITQEDLTIQYLHDNFIQKLRENRSDQFQEFTVKEVKDNKIEVFRYQPSKHAESHKLFEIKIEENDGKKYILITNENLDDGFSNRYAHIHYVRSIKEKESHGSLYDYFLKSFEKISQLFSQKDANISTFLQQHLYQFLDSQGYEIERRVRNFKPSYESSEILDIKSKENQEKFFEIFVYNVDHFFIGMQINSNNKVTEIKIPRNNLEDGFSKVKQQLELVCPKIDGSDRDQLQKFFGLNFDKKREIIIQQVANNCQTFQPDEKHLYDYPATAFLLNLSDLECDIGKSKIMVEQINNSFFQFFKSGYVVSPLSEDFEGTISKILHDSIEEIKQITQLKQNSQGQTEKPTLEIIKQEILNVSHAQNIQLICNDKENDLIQCMLNEVLVIQIAKVNVNQVDYFKVQFFKQPEKNQKTSKVLNDVKIPVDNEFNLHKRLTPIAEEFFKNYTLKIQFNLKYQFSQKIQQFQNEKFFIYFFYIFATFQQYYIVI